MKDQYDSDPTERELRELEEFSMLLAENLQENDDLVNSIHLSASVDDDSE